MDDDKRREIAAACESIRNLAHLAADLAQAQGRFDRRAHVTPWPNVINAYIAGCDNSKADALHYIDVLLGKIESAVSSGEGATDGR